MECSQRLYSNILLAWAVLSFLVFVCLYLGGGSFVVLRLFNYKSPFFFIIIITAWIVQLMSSSYDWLTVPAPAFLPEYWSKLGQIKMGISYAMPFMLLGVFIAKHDCRNIFRTKYLIIFCLLFLAEVIMLGNFGAHKEKSTDVLFLLPASFFVFLWIINRWSFPEKISKYAKMFRNMSTSMYCDNPYQLIYLSTLSIFDNSIILFIVTCGTSCFIAYIICYAKRFLTTIQ